MKQKIALIVGLGASSLALPAQADILISEYVEGSSNNKAIELVNTGEQSVLLDGFKVEIYFNGSTEVGRTLELNGTLESGEYYVIAKDIASSEILDVADLTGALDFNGDDTVLVRDSFNNIVDSIGQLGVDPGSEWFENGVGTQNETLRRKLEATAGDTNPDDAFDPSAQYDTFPIDTIDGLGNPGNDDGDGDGGDGNDDNPPNVGSPLILTAVFDGNLSGGLPKGVEIFVLEDIDDLSQCGVGVANNGGGSDGQEFTFPADSAQAGDFIYVASEADGFNTFFGFAPNYTSGSLSVNGDDAVELFCGGAVIDLYGDVNVIGDNEVWDYTDSYARRLDGTDANPSFNSADWEYAGRDGFDNGATANDVKLGTFSPSQRDLFISEYVEGGGFNKILEIVNVTGRDIDLSNYSVEGFQNGSATTSYTIALSGILADDSIFVLAHPDAALPTLDDGVTLQTANLQFNGDDAVVLMNNDTGVVDAIGQVGFDPGSQWGSGLTSTKDNTLRRMLSITSGDTAPDDAFDPSIEWEGFDKDTLDDVGKYPGLGGGNGGGNVALGVCGEEATFISAVQGSGSSTPLAGQTVVVEGVITYLAPDLAGFYMQEETADEDGDPATSEGLFVFTDDSDFGLAQGDVVRVLGAAGEFGNKTQITASEATSCGTGSNLVSMQSFTLPLAQDADLETIESMLVNNPQNFVVTGTFSYNKFGEVVVASERLYGPTQLHLPGSPEAVAQEEQNQRNQFILDDGLNGSYNDPVNFGELTPENYLRTGTIITGNQFVMDYAFNNYRLRPTAPLNYQIDVRPPAPQSRGNISLVAYNVLNLFNGDGNGNGFPTSRGATTFAEYERQLSKIVKALVELDASAIGLVELENDGYGADSAIAQLTDALNEAIGAPMYRFVDAGDIVGSDQITVGILYKPSLLSPVGALEVLTEANSISDDEGPLFNTDRNRPAFAQLFKVAETGDEFVFNVNHLKSKGSSCGSGDNDTETGQGNCNRTRTRAATALAAWLDTTFANKAAFIVGDLNSYAKEDPIRVLNDSGYTDLLPTFSGALAYSYVFRNQFGTLDYALANAQGLELVQSTSVWNLNSDELRAFDYNDELERLRNGDVVLKPESFFDDSEYRSSDHDAIIVGLQFENNTIRGDLNNNGRLDFGDYFIIARLRGVREGSDRYRADADLNGDGVIDRRDAREWFGLYLNQRRGRGR